MANLTNKDVGLAEWTEYANAEIKRLGVKGTPSALAFKHAWEFGNTARHWVLWLSEVEKKKEARKHNRPALNGTDSGGMEI